MYKFSFLAALAAFVLSLMMYAAPAQAQATRTWVSGVGANPCSRTAPCKTFAGAISKTSSPGEIDCLDPGGFGALTITKSITIICDERCRRRAGGGDQWICRQPPPPATSRVILSGLDFRRRQPERRLDERVGGQVTIRNSIIREFHSVWRQLGTWVRGDTRDACCHYKLAHHQQYSRWRQRLTGTSSNMNAEVLGTIIDSNGPPGITVTGPGALVIAGSTVTGQSTALSVVSGGQIISYGNNVIRNAGTPTSTLLLQ